jgi:hypothetical protein
VEKFVCLPNETSELGQCHAELAAAGVDFEPTLIAPESPSTHPNLTCSIQDPVYILDGVNGIDLLYYDGTPTNRQLMSCEGALSVADTVADVQANHAIPGGPALTAMLHIGTYVCRVIGGTDVLSRHSFGDAIDIYGFEFGNGSIYTLVDDWQHDTANPSSVGGAFLYDSAYRWFDDGFWEIILTPNFNAAHDNHFHVDLTPNGNFIGFNGEPMFLPTGRYIGPAPYAD